MYDINDLKNWVYNHQELINKGDFQALYYEFFHNGEPQCLLSVLLELSGFDISYILNHFKDEIPNYSFCGDLTSTLINKPYILSGVITIPKNISKIETDAFRGQTQVTKYVILNNNISQIKPSAFRLKTGTKKIIEFTGTRARFKKAILNASSLDSISKVICSDGEITW